MIAKKIMLGVLCVLGGCVFRPSLAFAQPTRLAVLQAEDRRAVTATDLAILRAGLHGADPQTTRIAVRAVGRLERPALIPDLMPALKHDYSRANGARTSQQPSIGSMDVSERFSRYVITATAHRVKSVR